MVARVLINRNSFFLETYSYVREGKIFCIGRGTRACIWCVNKESKQRVAEHSERRVPEGGKMRDTGNEVEQAEIKSR